jgi:signal recognition particle subunit SEC65
LGPRELALAKTKTETIKKALDQLEVFFSQLEILN